jgi:hypothetical protein
MSEWSTTQDQVLYLPVKNREREWHTTESRHRENREMTFVGDFRIEINKLSLVFFDDDAK